MSTTTTPEPESVGALVRGLADPVRLRLLAAVVEGSRTLEELASMLSIDIASASRQMKKLERAGLVVATSDTMIRYRGDLTKLQHAAMQLSEPTRDRAAASVADVDADTRDVLSAYFEGPRLKAMPVRQRKKELVLEEILRRIPMQQEYREAELSRFIEATFDDFCIVRREWVDRGYMTRESGIYRWSERGLAVLSARASSA